MKDLKIELKHPAGKKAVVMDKEKYYLIKNFILNYLKTNVKATHTEILESIKKDFKMNKTNFQG